MIPTNSSISTNGCDSISSNCVIWQGPDISCINLCNGDTISEVTAKLAELVCDLIEEGVTSNPLLTGLNLTCLNIPGTTPTTLVPVLQAMVVAICTKNGSDLPPASYVQNNLPIMTLPSCLIYDDPTTGNPVTQLRLDLFASKIAERVCSILTSISYIQTTLTNYNTRLRVLETCVLPCSGSVAETQVVPTCIINVGQLTSVSVLLLALEARFCALETAVGLPAAINLAISQGSCILSTTTTLANSAVTYGSITGWNNTPINLAQTTQNIWSVLCDMYDAISSIQTRCCPSGCDGVLFGYTTSNILASNGTISGFNFNFQNTVTDTGCIIPLGFNDCAGSTVITITDSLNVSVTNTVSVTSLQNSAGGVTISIPSLNTFGPLTTRIAFCVTNGTDTCNNTIVKAVPGVIPCPTDPTVGNITATGASVSFGNNLGSTAVYIIDIINNATSVVTATYTQNSPGTSVSHVFTGLATGVLYNVRITVQIGGQTKICTNTVSFTTSQTIVLTAFDYIIVTYQYAPPLGQDYDLDTLTTFRYPNATLAGSSSSNTTGYVAGTGVVGCGTPSPGNVIPTSGANMNTSYLFWGGDDEGQFVDGTYGESVIINFKNLETSGLLAQTNVIAELFAGWHSGPAGAYPISIKYQTFVGGTISFEVIGGIQTNRFVSTGTVVAAATSVPISVIAGNCSSGVSVKRNMASIAYDTTTNAATVTFKSY